MPDLSPTIARIVDDARKAVTHDRSRRPLDGTDPGWANAMAEALDARGFRLVPHGMRPATAPEADPILADAMRIVVDLFEQADPTNPGGHCRYCGYLAIDGDGRPSTHLADHDHACVWARARRLATTSAEAAPLDSATVPQVDALMARITMDVDVPGAEPADLRHAANILAAYHRGDTIGGRQVGDPGAAVLTVAMFLRALADGHRPTGAPTDSPPAPLFTGVVEGAGGGHVDVRVSDGTTDYPSTGDTVAVYPRGVHLPPTTGEPPEVFERTPGDRLAAIFRQVTGGPPATSIEGLRRFDLLAEMGVTPPAPETHGDNLISVDRWNIDHKGEGGAITDGVFTVSVGYATGDSSRVPLPFRNALRLLLNRHPDEVPYRA